MSDRIITVTTKTAYLDYAPISEQLMGDNVMWSTARLLTSPDRSQSFGDIEGDPLKAGARYMKIYTPGAGVTFYRLVNKRDIEKTR